MRAFRLIDQERAHHAVSVLCSVPKVTRQGYYAWKRRRPSARRRRDDELKADILALFARSRDTYGAPRIRDRLRIEKDIWIGQKRAARLMRELGIQGTGKGQRRVRTTIPDRRAPAAPDHVGRDFTASRPDEKWVADITYIPTHQGWLLLAAVSDCYSRRIVGWSMRDTLEAELVADAIAMAVATRSWNQPSGPSTPSSSTAMSSTRETMSASPSSTTSKPSGTPSAHTAPWGISAPTNTKPNTIKPTPPTTKRHKDR